MGRCVICGETITTRIETILVNGKRAAVVSFGNQYCPKCAAKRIEELRATLKMSKNVMAIAPQLRFSEEMKIIDV